MKNTSVAKLILLLSAIVVPLAVFAADTPVQIGKLAVRSSAEGASPRIGIGFEKLDRDVFDPEKAYDKLAAIGVKWVRLQSGWQRTEKVKGQYDFAWLDSVVDNIIRRGMTPWLNLCYGNELYSPDAKKYFGAVGVPPIKTAEERDAWAAYVSALVKHFKGRVSLYEIWNEPDGSYTWKHGVNPKEYADFAIATAKAIRAADPGAKIAAGALCNLRLPYANAMLSHGLGEYVDAITYHNYTVTELTIAHQFKSFAALVKSHNPKLEIIQGESGAQSNPKGKGALRHFAWTPAAQAKLLLRHLFTDLTLDIPFTSYFSTLDMIEALNGRSDDKSSYLDYGYFGVLGADFDEDGRSTGEYTPKPSYYALQNLCAVFTEDVTFVDLPVQFADSGKISGQNNPKGSIRNPYGFEPCLETSPLQYYGLRKSNGAVAFAYWNATDLMTTDYAGAKTVTFANLPRPIRLIDLMTGEVFEIPESMLIRPPKSGETEKCDSWFIANLPLKDYPLLLTFGDFAPVDRTKKTCPKK